MNISILIFVGDTCPRSDFLEFFALLQRLMIQRNGTYRGGKMKIGVSAFAWTTKLNRSHLHLFSALREHGLEAIEIPIFEPAALATADIRRACEAHALACTVCCILPAGSNPISPDAAVRKRSR